MTDEEREVCEEARERWGLCSGRRGRCSFEGFGVSRERTFSEDDFAFVVRVCKALVIVRQPGNAVDTLGPMKM